MSTFNGQNGSSNSQGEPHKSGRNGHTPGIVWLPGSGITTVDLSQHFQV